MKGLLYFAITLGIVVVIAIAILLVVLAVRHFTTKRKRVLWDEAVANAQWEEFVDYRAGQTYVGIRQVARVGRVRETLREEVMPDFPQTDPLAIDVEVATWEARRRRDQLNK